MRVQSVVTVWFIWMGNIQRKAAFQHGSQTSGLKNCQNGAGCAESGLDTVTGRMVPLVLKLLSLTWGFATQVETLPK